MAIVLTVCVLRGDAVVRWWRGVPRAYLHQRLACEVPGRLCPGIVGIVGASIVRCGRLARTMLLPFFLQTEVVLSGHAGRGVRGGVLVPALHALPASIMRACCR